MSPLFTIIVPTYDHQKTLKYSLGSVLNQTFKDFSVQVIGDGADRVTAKLVQAIAKKDARVRYHHFPKSARTGEEYRHQILKTTTSKYVCYLSDDDLWFPDHLSTMKSLLERVDFAYTLPIMLQPNDTVETWYGNVTQPFYIKIFLDSQNTRHNFIPLSCAGHRLSIYRKLSHGWESTPPGKHTDLHMWQKFVSHPKVRIRKSPHLTVLHLASSQRRNFTKADRLTEIKLWSQKIQKNQKLREQLLEGLLESVTRNFLDYRATSESISDHKSSTKNRNLLERIRNFLGTNR